MDFLATSSSATAQKSVEFTANPKMLKWNFNWTSSPGEDREQIRLDRESLQTSKALKKYDPEEIQQPNNLHKSNGRQRPVHMLQLYINLIYSI